MSVLKQPRAHAHCCSGTGKKAKMRQYQFLHNTGLEWQLPTTSAYNLLIVWCKKYFFFFFKIYDHLLCSAFDFCLIEFCQRCQQTDSLWSNTLWHHIVDCVVRGDNMQICRGLAGQMGRNRRKGGRFQSSPKAAPPSLCFVPTTTGC